MKIKPLKVNLQELKWRFLTDYKINEKIILPFPILLVGAVPFATHIRTFSFINRILPEGISVLIN